MEIVGWFFYYKTLALLVLFPIALFAVGVGYIERTRPRVVFWISLVVIGVVVTLAGAEVIEALRTGEWTQKTLVHVVIALCLTASLVLKSKRWLHPDTSQGQKA